MTLDEMIDALVALREEHDCGSLRVTQNLGGQVTQVPVPKIAWIQVNRANERRVRYWYDWDHLDQKRERGEKVLRI